MLMSHFIGQTANTSVLVVRPSSVTHDQQQDRNHPFSLLQCRQVGGVGDGGGRGGGGGVFTRRSWIQVDMLYSRRASA